MRPNSSQTTMLAIAIAGLLNNATFAQEPGTPEEIAWIKAHNEAEKIPPPVDQLPPHIVAVDGCIGWPADLLPQRGTFNLQQWPGGIVPFEWDANVSGANRLQMVAAMNLWQNIGNITFQLRNGEANYIHIQSATFNLSSGIGMIGGRQDIFITSWTNNFIQAHELAHSLGFFHEQQRSDRNSFVQIESANICQTCCQGGPCDGNFGLGGGAIAYGPYDFDSVMHYGQCFFSACNPCNGEPNCRTITVLPPWDTDWQANIGQRNHLSAMDQLTMSFLYPESNWRFVDQGWGGAETGAFLTPFDTVAEGVTSTPAGGTLWIQPSAQTYPAATTYTKTMFIRAPLGGVRLGS